MNIWMIIGLALGAGTVFTDRVIHKIPNKLAIVLLVVAVILIIVGFVVSRRTGV